MTTPAMKAYIFQPHVSTMESLCRQFVDAERRGIAPVERAQIRNTIHDMWRGELPDDAEIRRIASVATGRIERLAKEQREALASAAAPIVTALRREIAATPGFHRGARPTTEYLAGVVSEAYPEIPASDRAEIARLALS